MSAHKLMEFDVTMIRDYLIANMPGALASIRADRADARVSTESPKKYFIYAMAKGFEVPCIFIIGKSLRMMNTQHGSNSIAAVSRIGVSALIQDRVRDNLVYKSWRYQSALHNLLHLNALTSSDSKLKIVSKVDEITFSPEFSDAKDPSSPEGVFRKEVLLDLEVEHYENL